VKEVSFYVDLQRDKSDGKSTRCTGEQPADLFMMLDFNQTMIRERDILHEHVL
jgi:hypothetical protein